MADTKLSDLTALAVEPADTDEVYINDGGTSKKITYGTLKTALLARANHTGTQTASTISDFDTEVSNNSDVAANTAKVTNATHTGDAAGSGALTLQPAAITGKGSATAAAGDLLLAVDVSVSPQVLTQITAGDIAALAAPQGTAILSSDSSPLPANGDLLTANGAGGAAWVTPSNPTESLIVALGDESTALTTGVKVTLYAPYAMTLTGIKASVVTAPTDATLITDVHLNGTTIMTTNKLQIETGEFHTKDATTQPALTTTAIAEDDKLEFEVDQIGSTVAGAGLKVMLIGYRS